MRRSSSLKLALAVTAAIGMLLAAGCADREPPKREHIPLLRQALQKLGETVKAQNRAAIDSLLSVQILDEGENSDSLLGFVYGPNRDFPFGGFALGEIIYRNNVARIDCFVADTSMSKDRPATLTLVYEHERWLLKRFDLGKPDDADSSDFDSM